MSQLDSIKLDEMIEERKHHQARSYRSRDEIWARVLESCKNPILASQLVLRTRSQYCRVYEILSVFQSAGLVRCVETDGRIYFSLTRKGCEYLEIEESLGQARRAYKEGRLPQLLPDQDDENLDRRELFLTVFDKMKSIRESLNVEDRTKEEEEK